MKRDSVRLKPLRFFKEDPHPDVERNDRFQRLSLQLFFEQGPLVYLGVIVNAVVFVIFSWPRIHPGLLTTWLGALMILTAFRAFTQWRWLRSESQGSIEEQDAMIKKIQSSVVLSGLLWGSTGLMAFFNDSPAHLTFTSFILAGMSAGAVSAYTAFPRFVHLFLVTSLTPLIVALFFQGTRDTTGMAMMGLVYMGFMAGLARNSYLRSMRFLEVSFQNEDLVSRLNNASHEIRTPVAAISGFAELLREHPQASEEIKNYSTIIHRNGVYLTKLVNNILLLSQNEHGVANNQKETVSMGDEINALINTVNVTERPVNFKVTYEGRCPEKIIINSLKFKQVMMNLLSNALKFTPSGEISVLVKSVLPGRLTVRVSDTGIGMSEKSAEQLFQPFFRENRTEVKTQEGSGLGLALSRSLARSMGGHLSLLESRVGQGSVFEFEFPFEIPVEPKVLTNPPKGERLKGQRIALVDDAADIRMLISKQLEMEGATVQTYTDGERVVEKLRESQDVDLILMDINMPVMDGYEAAERIRRRGFEKPIIAFTAYSIADRKKYQEAGFTGHISKTQGLAEVVPSLMKWLPRAPETAPA